MFAGATVTLIDVVARALTRLAEQLPPSLAERASALAVDRAALGRKLAQIRRSPSDREAVERLFYRTWIACLWILTDDLSHLPSRPLTPDEEADWRRAWQFTVIANPRRMALVRAKAAESPGSAIAWSAPDNAFVPSGTGAPSIQADIGAALIRAGTVYNDTTVTAAITAAVKNGWRNVNGDLVGLLDLATDAFICGPRDSGALALFFPLLIERGSADEHLDQISIARAGMAIQRSAKLPRRVIEFSWFVSGWHDSGERSEILGRPPSIDELEPMIVDTAKIYGVTEAAVEQILLAGIETPEFATDSGARRSLLDAVSSLERLLPEFRSRSQPGQPLAAIFESVVDALEGGDFARADRILAALLDHFEASSAALAKADRAMFVALICRLRGNLSCIRFDAGAALRDYERAATAVADVQPETSMYARSSQATMLSVLANWEREPAHLQTALALWREEIASLAREVGTAETCVDANVGLGHALLALANQTGDLAFIAEAAIAFRAGLSADRLVALDGPGPTLGDKPTLAGPPTVDQVRSGFLLVECLLRVGFENPDKLLVEAENVLNLLRPWISRDEQQTHWGWMRMLEAYLAIERNQRAFEANELADLAARLTEAAEALTPISRVQWARCWLLLGEAYEVAAYGGDHARLVPCIACLEKAKDALTPSEHDLWLRTVIGLAHAHEMALERTRYLPNAIAWIGNLRAGLVTTTRQRSPYRWIVMQQRLGDALSAMFEREGHPDMLDATVDCYREALSGRSQVDDPQDWLATTFKLAQVLVERGSWNRNRAEISEAMELLHEARLFAERRDDRDSVEAIDRRLARAAMLAEALDAPLVTPKRGFSAWLRERIARSR